MIVVNGTQYRTLDQKLYADGKRVMKAYVNGTKVYPERGDGYIVKLGGRADYTTSHTEGRHGGNVYRWICQPVADYSFSCAFSIVFRCSKEISPYSRNLTLPALSYENIQNATSTWQSYAYADMLSVMWPQPFYPHPVYGQPELNGISILGIRNVKSAEILFDISTSDIPMHPGQCCILTEDSDNSGGITPDGWNESLFDVTAIPVEGALPGFSGKYHVFCDSRFLVDDVPAYTNNSFRVHLRRADSGFLEDRGLTCLFFDAPYPDDMAYSLEGHRWGSDKTETAIKTFHNEGFYYTVGMAPYTDIYYCGSEAEAPEEMLHPVESDL